MALADDQQFCLRWNNFQANITSQFEALRDDEDFTDVTIACEGQRMQAHKVVLSACSPFFKELFKVSLCFITFCLLITGRYDGQVWLH
ncbi:BTB domain containing protein [Asbolus verrucosus]|uniref:BTB domain containing protein n=1 Tax=Asbolus verrucosus TaxID=1661398 RepID=A0A482VXI9_ASBVE|nr:BTB domain containing protein [Asbolus verrucosus]